MSADLNRLIVLIKSGGEVGSGVAHKLANSHFRVLITETAQPLAVSRGVAFCEAIYDGFKEVSGAVARKVGSADEIPKLWHGSEIPIIVDPEAKIIAKIKPQVVVDAIMAKKNLGTKLTDAPLVIGLGPGFTAGKDVHVVVETNNSENLGRVILKGEAEENTGIPIAVGGLTGERVIHADEDGLFLTDKEMGDDVKAGEVVATLSGKPLKAGIDGFIRALLRSNIEVKKDTKLVEIDPTSDKEVCYTIRARIRAISGGVLEAILMRFND